MLTFSQKNSTIFSASLKKPIDENVWYNSSRSVVLEAPFSETESAHVNKKSLEITCKREKYLTDLAGKYLCTWKILLFNNVDINHAECISDEQCEKAFYASIPLSFEKRCKMKHLKDCNGKPSTAKDNCVTCGNECISGTMIHDWSKDKFLSESLIIKGRTHLLFKYVHPCDFGETLIPVTAIVKSETMDLPTLVKEHVPNPSSLSSKYIQELTSVLKSRNENKGANVVSVVEQNQEQKRKQEVENRHFAMVKEEEKRQLNTRACDDIINRSRTMQLQRRPSQLATIAEETSSTSSGSDESDIDSDTNSSSDTESDDDSTTFSDETSEEEEEEDSTEWQVQRRRNRTKTHHFPLSLVPRPADSVSVSVSEEVESSIKTETVEKTCEIPMVVDEVKNVVENVVENVKEKEKFTRQNNAEIMVPVCLPTDTFAFFEQLECPFVMQWADEEHRKLHLYRRFNVSQRTYLLYSYQKVYFQLITSIELV